MSHTCYECGEIATYYVPQDPGDGEYYPGNDESYWCTTHGYNHIDSRPLEDNVMLTKERAEEIMATCRLRAEHGPWVDQLDKVMTKDERMEVMEYWMLLPGHTSFTDAFLHFVKGKVAYREILPEDVEKSLFAAFGKRWPTSSFIGRIMPQDVGKRVYLVKGPKGHLMGDILQVENEEQRTERLKVKSYKQFQEGSKS